jgi:hypothetical protein
VLALVGASVVNLPIAPELSDAFAGSSEAISNGDANADHWHDLHKLPAHMESVNFWHFLADRF